MLEPLSLTAIGAVLGALGNGVASEAGKRLWESAGGVVRRIAGREVAAPAGPQDQAAVARLVHEAVGRDPELARAWAALAHRVPPVRRPEARPRGLPVSSRHFTDREQAMKVLDREAGRRADGRPKVALLHGPEGIGTSALAVHWGARAAGLFPDGQLYADLRGPAGGGQSPGRVLHSLLRQFELPEEEIPPAFQGRRELFTRCVEDRRVLLVLDHAHSAAQVEPLLTAAPEVFTLVVARRPLTGLDALPVPVGPLTDKDARRLLTALVGGRSALAPHRAELPAVLARCGGSPFALRAAVPRLGAHGSVPLPAQRAQEADTMADDHPVQAAAEDAYRTLGPEAARLYRQLGLWEWPAFDAAAAARTLRADEPLAAGLLEELAAVRLLERTGDGRYHYRPRVRRHAEALAHADGMAACAAAVARSVEGYARLAAGAARAALPESWRVPDLPTGAATPVYADRGEALAALVAERENLVQAVRAADEFGDPEAVSLLCRALWPLQLKAGHHEALLPALRTGARTADAHFPGTRASGALHAQLALSLAELRHFDEAEPEALAAVRDERAAGHVRGQASALEFLGLLRLRQWRFDEAYGCFEDAEALLGEIGPADEGAADVPRARALLERHRGRALSGLGRHEEAAARLGAALRFFRGTGEAYNTARALTDLAESRLASGGGEAAAPLIDEAIALLTAEGAEYHLAHLRTLRGGGAVD
ncbi:tetratricopeptide repeat protein [Streptomyces monticola]|uniref:Tetratricopeptide repeat protein n=1 Tax=Streptomyces monticola TaxID=2666263 RepID=A0ABW2JWZ3_9ACTN